MAVSRRSSDSINKVKWRESGENFLLIPDFTYMTFRRSLYISIAVHALIFGAAIAFAWRAGGLFLPSEHVMPVSLVSSDSGPFSGGGVAGKQNGRMREAGPEDDKFPAEQQREMMTQETGEVSTDMKAESMMSADGNASPAGAGGAGKGDQTAVFSETGQNGGGGGAGFVAPNQWAAIESAIERVKSYPRMARERGIQGVVHVRFKLKSSGAVEAVEIVKSSGYDILDEAAVRTIYRASSLFPYVEGWGEQSITYVLK
ncbi:MAG TPA: energy transducer TonB [Nitrospirota bacterium]